ncbi:MAG: UDP-3-O-(3-hydroxymyristoyl)glucosamine N-acyltransferase [Campylobacterota bacterium]|nr:UDP-3-O-(3-hydroxymyristoyl)glucosamine N-acyltransferase [Campylobacterota bacterium]
MLLSLIAKEIGLEFLGDDVEITGLNTLQNATQEEISFVNGDKYLDDIANSSAAAVIVEQKFVDKLPSTCRALISDEPYLKMALASKFFAPKLIDNSLEKPLIGKDCYISEKAELLNGIKIADGCTIMSNVTIGCGVTIGSGVVIHPNVSIYRDTIIGDNCIIHSGAVIGSDGFGFAHTKMGEHIKIYQNGNVVLEDDVEIGANTTVDCAVFGTTLIKRGSKIDNLVQIGHNCVIGEYGIIVAQAGVSGSTTFGRNVILGGQSATAGHLKIAPFTTIAARGGVTKDIKEPNKTFAGFPLMEHRVWLKLQAKIAKLIK